MQPNPKKVKFILFLAIVLAIALFTLCIGLIISINNKKQEIKKQELELSKLNNQLEYFQNQPTNTEDNSIVIEEQ